MVVTPFSIPVSATQVPDVELSSNEGSEEVLKDSDDEPVMKMRVSNSNDKLDTEAMGMHLRSLLSPPMGMHLRSLLCIFDLALHVISLCNHRCP